MSQRSASLALLLVVAGGCRRNVDLPLSAADARPELDTVVADAEGQVDALWPVERVAVGWAVAPSGTVAGQSVAVDDSGHGLIAGSYRVAASFGACSLAAPPGQIGPRAFVARLDPKGAFLWAVGAEGAGVSVIRAVAAGGGGAGIVAGEQSGSVTLGGHSLAPGDGFVARIDASGAVAWVAVASTTQPPLRVRGVTVDAAGNTTVTGSFTGAATFGPRTLTSTGSHDWFAARLDAKGGFVWAVSGGSSDPDHGVDIGADAAGNVHVAVQSSRPGAMLLESVEVMKLDASGTALWTVRGETSGGPVDLGGIAVDKAGESWITGTGSGQTGELQLGGLTLPIPPGKYNASLFAARLDSGGKVPWVSVVSGATATNPWSSDQSRVQGLAVAADGVGNSYLTGALFGSLTFNGTVYNATSQDVFVAKLRPDGSRAWIVGGGGAADDRGIDIAVDVGGSVWVLGALGGGAGRLGGQQLSGETFVARLSPLP